MFRHIYCLSARCPLSRLISVTPVASANVRCLQNLVRTRPTIYTYSVATPPFGLRRNVKRFRIAMTQEEKDRKLQKIEEMRVEEMPKGLFAKFKYYFKRYWYIAIPVHTVCCTMWFAGLYISIKSGVDIIALMHTLHLPETLIEKVKNVPESAGVIVIALLLYKIAVPIRYAMSLGGIQLAFRILRRMGKLKTVREVEYGVRTGYEKTIHRINDRRTRSAMISPNNAANITPQWTLSRILTRREKKLQQQSAQKQTASATNAATSKDENLSGKKPTSQT